MRERVTYSKSMSAPPEFADRDPAFFFYVREQIGRDLANTLLDKIEAGEKIVGLQEIKTEQIDLYRVKYSRYMNVEDIVRCKDCIHEEDCLRMIGERAANVWHGIDYCSRGERRTDA